MNRNEPPVGPQRGKWSSSFDKLILRQAHPSTSSSFDKLRMKGEIGSNASPFILSLSKDELRDFRMNLIREFVKRIVQRLPMDVRWTEFLLSKGLIDTNTYYDILTDLVMQRVLKTSSVCVDVGCYKGSILRLMMKYAPAGRFLAFEPLPHLYGKIKDHFNSDNVQIYNLALSDSAGTSSFNWVVSNPAYSGLKKRRYDRPNETDSQIEVKVDTLDNILGKERIGKVSFIKIDVEGAEYFVLKGAENCIKRDKPVIVFEHGLGGSDCYGRKPEDVYELLYDRCGLNISLLSDYLSSKPPLDRKGFCDQFYKGKHYFFIAY